MTERIKGVITDVISPFDDQEQLDEGALREMVDFLIEEGVHSIVATLTIGEFSALSVRERNRIVKVIVDQANGRVPVYAGTGAISTRDTISLSKYAQDIGVDAVMVITPYYSLPNARDLYRHYETLAVAVDIPIVPYNNPRRTGIHMSLELLCRLVEIDNVVGIKDSSGDLVHFGELVRCLGDRVSILMGRDDLILPGLIMGADGTVNAVGNIIPKLLVEMYDSVERGNLERARQIQYEFVTPLFRELLEIGTLPAQIKEAAKLIGKRGGYPRKPVFPLDRDLRLQVENLLKKLKVL